MGHPIHTNTVDTYVRFRQPYTRHFGNELTFHMFEINKMCKMVNRLLGQNTISHMKQRILV